MQSDKNCANADESTATTTEEIDDLIYSLHSGGRKDELEPGIPVEFEYYSKYSDSLVTKSGVARLTDGWMLAVEVDDECFLVTPDYVSKDYSGDATTWRNSSGKERTLGHTESLEIVEPDSSVVTDGGDDIVVVEVIVEDVRGEHRIGYVGVEYLDLEDRADTDAVREEIRSRIDVESASGDIGTVRVAPDGDFEFRPRSMTDGGVDQKTTGELTDEFVERLKSKGNPVSRNLFDFARAKATGEMEVQARDLGFDLVDMHERVFVVRILHSENPELAENTYYEVDGQTTDIIAELALSTGANVWADEDYAERLGIEPFEAPQVI